MKKNFFRFVVFIFLNVLAIVFNNQFIFADTLDHPIAINKIFPDKGFLAAILKHLNKTSINEIITQNDLNSIKIFSQSGRSGIPNKINNIEGAQYLNNLESFELNGSNISDLKPLSNLNNLQSLLLRFNAINDLSPVSNLVNLRRLDLTHNQISNLTPLMKLTNLYSLTLNDNHIDNLIPLKNLTKLKLLDLTDNQIENLASLMSLTNLEALALRNNPIKDLIPLKKLIKLKELSLGGVINYDQFLKVSTILNIEELIIMP